MFRQALLGGLEGGFAASCNAIRDNRSYAELMDVSYLIVDDNREFLETARSLLVQEGLRVVGVAASGEEALRRAGELTPDVILVDIDLGSESGFAVARQLAAADGARRLILISTHAEDEFVELIEASPAIGFLPKSELSAEAIATLLRDAA